MTRRSWQSSPMRPALKAELVLGGAVLAHLVVVETMLVTADAGRNSLLTVAEFFGLHVAAVMMVQVVLVARLPWLDRRLGMDRLTAWHRWVGIALVWTIACHATFVLLGFSRLNDASVPETFWSLAGVTASLLGMCAAAIVVVVVVVSTRCGAAPASVRGVARYVHLLLYVAIGLALVHQALEGTAFDVPDRRRLLVDDVDAGAGLAARVQGGRARSRNPRHRFRVEAVTPESGRCRLGAGHRPRPPPAAGPSRPVLHLAVSRPLRLVAGQPVLPVRRTRRQAAPADGEGRRRDQRRAARAPRRHARASIEGPYGAFTRLQQATDKTLLIAGGIGVTPIRALLEEVAGSTILIYRVSSSGDAVLLPELEALARRARRRPAPPGRSDR